MKKVLMFILALFIASGTMKAQLYGSGIYYFIPVNQSLSDNSKVYIIFFDGNRCFAHEERRSKIVYNLNGNPNYYIDYAKRTLNNPDNGIKYDSSLSTSSRVVYKSTWYGAPQNVGSPSDPWSIHQPILGNYYKAFSKDKSSMIEWRERKNSGSVENKTYYTQVDIKDILPKAANHDFLYE